MMRFVLLLAALLASAVPVQAQITITYTFTSGTSADPTQVNTNFSTLGSQALNRTGGTLTGNIAANAGVTIDGIDIGATVCTTCTPTFSTLALSGAGLTLSNADPSAGVTASGATNSNLRLRANGSMVLHIDLDNGGSESWLFRNGAGSDVATIGESGAAAFSGTLTVQSAVISAGTGSPEGVVTGAVGDIFIRRDGGAATVFYVKESGASNTGWVAK